MEPPERAERQPGAPFRPLPGEDGAAVAARVVAFCASTVDALAPIIGMRGVMALLQRGLHVAGARHPALAGASAGPMAEVDLGALQARMATQDAPGVADFGNTVAETVTLLLRDLVGASLTERLLPQVKHHTLGDLSARDTSA